MIHGIMSAGFISIPAVQQFFEHSASCQLVLESVYIWSIYALQHTTALKLHRFKQGTTISSWSQYLIHNIFHLYPNATDIHVKLLNSLLGCVFADNKTSQEATVILMNLQQVARLDRFSHLLEDALFKTISPSSSVSVDCVHSLSLLMCKVCQVPSSLDNEHQKRKTIQSLLIFVRKHLLSLQDERIQAGLVCASHLLHEEVLSVEGS